MKRSGRILAPDQALAAPAPLRFGTLKDVPAGKRKDDFGADIKVT